MSVVIPNGQPDTGLPTVDGFVAEVGGNLLGPLERRVERLGPGHRHVRVGLVAAPDVIPLHLLGGRQLDAVERQDLTGRANHRSLGAGPVVPPGVDDERVIELAHLVDRVDHPADFVWMASSAIAAVRLNSGLPT